MDYEEEWEFLPDSRFLDFPENPEERKVFSGNKGRGLNPESVFDMDYFMCPSSESKETVEASPGNSSREMVVVTNHRQLVPVPIQLEPAAILKQGHHHHRHQPRDSEADRDEKMERSVGESDQEPLLSQVFFKKMKENEFVDMKILDSSPKSPRNNMIPHIDSPSAIDNMTCSPRKKKIADQKIWNHDHDHDRGEEDDYGLGLNLWKWSLTGIGAICSFGAAAATICVIIFGNQQKNKKHEQNQKLRFKIYTDDKRIKQVVQQATKLNEAISAVRGVPIARAHITFGGYFDAL